ncbi:hypothetical protein KCU73_g14689, partial [Aureobasidium melanogenum]
EQPRQQAEQSEEHAEEPQTTAEDTPEQDEPDQQSSKHTDEDDGQTLEQNEELDQRDDDETPEQNEELDQQSPEHTDEDDDETPSLDFMHGKKRRRQIPSSDSESSELETTSAAPAATTSTSSTVNQGTVAPIITFGSAAPRTLVVSTKPINRRTANDYAGTSGMVYSCPVAGCEQPMNEAYTIERFYKHLDDALHTDYFYHQNTHVCPFGCQKGFLNDFALHRHIQQSSCEESNALSDDIKTCKQCNDTSFPDIIGALVHLADDHEDMTSRIGSPYVCAPCDVGFPT